MKNIALVLSLLLFSAYQGHTQGFIVSYEETISIKLQANLDHIGNPQIRAAIEDNMRGRGITQTKNAKLFVNNDVSAYKADEYEQVTRNQEMPEGNARGNHTTQFTAVTPHLVYKNHLNSMILTQVSIDGKEYLVEEPFTERKWKIGKKKRHLLGYDCIEASSKTAGGMSVVVWYAPDIPISDGPSSHRGLPGLILYVNVDNGTHVFSCTSIKPNDNLLAIEAPNTGERISKEQYNKMNEERMQSIQEGRVEYQVREGSSTVQSGSTVIRR
jgi:Protein of unknown function (Porph_ging).